MSACWCTSQFHLVASNDVCACGVFLCTKKLWCVWRCRWWHSGWSRGSGGLEVDVPRMRRPWKEPTMSVFASSSNWDYLRLLMTMSTNYGCCYGCLCPLPLQLFLFGNCNEGIHLSFYLFCGLRTRLGITMSNACKMVFGVIYASMIYLLTFSVNNRSRCWSSHDILPCRVSSSRRMSAWNPWWHGHRWGKAWGWTSSKSHYSVYLTYTYKKCKTY